MFKCVGSEGVGQGWKTCLNSVNMLGSAFNATWPPPEHQHVF